MSATEECHEQLQRDVHSSIVLDRAQRKAVLKAGPTFQDAKSILISEFWKQHEANGHFDCFSMEVLTSHGRRLGGSNHYAYTAIWHVTLSDSQKLAIIADIDMLGHEMKMSGYKLEYDIVSMTAAQAYEHMCRQQDIDCEIAYGRQQNQWSHSAMVGEEQQINGHKCSFITMITLAVITSK